MCNNGVKPIVVVTGFGPFTGGPNASWEGVKLLDKAEIEQKHNIELVLCEIPVSYGHVDSSIPALWKTHTPKLTIHAGVSSYSQQFTLETQAAKNGYCLSDCFQSSPANQTCPAEGASTLHTKLDVQKICTEFNHCFETTENLRAVASTYAGRYLCEYIYYHSLSVDNSRTLFVHVPDFGTYSSQQTARGLAKILDLCLAQLRETEVARELSSKLNDTSLREDSSTTTSSSDNTI